jgi:hypothetical protein
MLIRFMVTLSTSENLLYWQRHKPAPLEIASITITRQSLLRSRLEYCSAARLPSHCHKEDYGLAVLKNAESHQPASRYAAHSARCTARCSAVPKEERSTALFKATVSADSQPASCYTARSARCTARCSARQKERSTALFRATVSADLLRIVRDCRGKYRHPTSVFRFTIVMWISGTHFLSEQQINIFFY